MGREITPPVCGPGIQIGGNCIRAEALGAEKALFRHISDGSPPPKHGLLYQHPSVKKASRKDKGRVSRKLAAKVAITAKVEYYGDKNERG